METHVPVAGPATQALAPKPVIIISHHSVQWKCSTPLLVFTNNRNRTISNSCAALMCYIDHLENSGARMD